MNRVGMLVLAPGEKQWRCEFKSRGRFVIRHYVAKGLLDAVVAAVKEYPDADFERVAVVETPEF